VARLELIHMGEVSWLAANGWRMKAARRRCEPDAPMKSGIGVGMSGHGATRRRIQYAVQDQWIAVAVATSREDQRSPRSGRLRHRR